MTAGKADILGISGRTAIVSGSTRGVGLAIAAALAAAGANVVALVVIGIAFVGIGFLGLARR